MKKIIVIVLCVLIVCVSASALAATEISWSGSDTKTLRSWTEPAQSEGDDWYIKWGDNTNIASDRRAYVRVHSGYKAASPAYVYSEKSTTPHDYNSGYGNGQSDTELRGRLDNRDGAQAPLIVDGYFYN